MKYRYDMLAFMYSQQDPGSTVWYLLKFLDTLSGDHTEKCVTMIQFGGDKAVDEFLSISRSV